MQQFIPSIKAILLDGWYAKESITIRAPSGEANVIASSEPLDPSIDTLRYAVVQGELLKSEFPGYTEFTFEPTTVLGDRDGYSRQFEWTPPDSSPVTQIQLYYVENGRGYTATATSLSSNFSRNELQLEKLLNGLTIG
jgi:hypothetical protein